jgi:signal transduction histidine kinase
MPNVEYPQIDPAAITFTPEEQRALDDINSRIGAGEDLGTVLDFLFDNTREIMPCDRISAAFFEEDGARALSWWVRADYDRIRLKTGYRADMAGSSLEDVMNRGAPRIIHDLETYLEENPDSNSTRLLRKEGVRSNLTCPLVVAKRPVGLLFRSSKESDSYGHREVALHQAITTRLSQAVEKAWQIEQLRKANQDYFDVLGFVTHELKSPLASVITQGRLLTEGYFGDMSPEQAAIVERMLANSDYLLNLVGDFLNLSRLETGEFQLDTREVDFIEDILEPALDLVEPQRREVDITLERETIGTPAPLTCDPNIMKIVLTNLLSNGIKYNNPGGILRITLNYADPFKVSIWNTGPGFEPEQRAKLFKKFSRLASPELMKKKGTGIGLYTAWRLVAAHKGHLTATSQPGQNAEFTFTLPGQPV